MYKIMNTNNIAKAVQATKIEEKKFEYNNCSTLARYGQ